MKIKEYISSGIIEQYVTGLCSESEKLELESLRSQFPELNNAITEYEIQLEKNMQLNSIMPAAETDKKILKMLAELSPVSTAPSSETTIRKMSWLRPVSSAAIFLLIVSGYFIYTFNDKINRLQEELNDIRNNSTATLPSTDYRIMLDPKITPVAMYGVGTHAICRCTMFWDKNTGKIYIMIHHLPLSSSSKDYQLWAMVNGQPVSVGIIKDEIRGRFIELDNVPIDAKAFSVTLENAGGNSTPTMSEEYLRGNI